MSIKAIVFDMDDTLFREIDYIFSGYKAVDKWLVENFQIHNFYKIATSLFRKGYRKNTFNKALEQLGKICNEELIMEMINIYRTHTPTIELCEDAKWLINHLIDSVKLGVISDGYLSAQEKKVEALKLKGKFHSIVLSDLYGRQNWKPSPLPYVIVSQELNCLHKECLYIGDNVNKDFITAKELGWKTIYIRRNDGIYFESPVKPEYSAHYQIQNLKELYWIEDCKHLFIDSEDYRRVVMK
ncbi:MAG: HAD family hydrolase [Bacillota bacterium]|nr:HAD family hydrolase [Bacillota bacterium]